MANWWDEFYSTKPDKPRSPGLEPAPAAPLAGLSSVAPSSSFAERVNQLGGPSPFAGIDYTAAPPAPALPMPPKPQPAFDLGNTASALWEGATQQLVPGVKSALAQAYTGLDRPDANPEWATRWMSEGRAAQQQADARTEELRKAGQLDSTSEAIRQAIPSLGFSGVTMLGSVPAGIGAGVLAGAASANPIVGGVAGATAAGAAGGALGYRMAGSQFMNDSFAQLEEESQKRRGRGLTDQEKQQAYDALLPVAQNTGLWEAGPEAVGNAAMFGLGKIALGILPKDAMAKLASSTLGKIGVRAGAGAGALGTEVATEGVTQFVQGNDQQRGQAITEALLSGKDPNEAAAAAVPQYQGAAGLWQATKDVAPATIATVLLMGGIAKPAHMVGSAIQNRREGNAAVSNAETATADLRANLDFAREGDILTALQGYDAIEQERTLPKAARERLDGARRQLLDELQLRASPAALNESLDTARGATGYLGFAQRTNELDDAAVQEAAERPLADDAAPALLEARKAYQQEWQSRQELNQAAAHFEQNPGAVEGVAKVLGNLAAGKPMTKGAHGSVDYNLASLADEQAIRYRNAGRVLLRDHADALGKLAAPVKNAVELLDEEISNRSTGQRRDPQAIREADVAARIAKVGDKYMATLLKGLSVDALERMASGLESRAGLEPDLAAKVATIRALADARKTEATPPPAPQPAQPPVNPPAPAAPAAPKSREALAAEVAALNQNRLPTPPQAPVPAVPEPALPQPAPALPGPVVPNVQNPTEMGQRMLAEALARQQAVRGQQAPALPTPSGTKELARLLGPRPTPQTIQAPTQAQTPDLLSGPARLGIVPSGGFAQGPLALPQPGANRNAENVRSDQGQSGQGSQEGQPGLRRGPVESGVDLRGAGQNRQGPQPTRQGAASEVAAREPSPPAETVAAPPAKPPVELPAGPERAGRGGTEGAGTQQKSELGTRSPKSEVAKGKTEEWQRFDPQSGTLGVPRSEMPQVKAEHRGALVNFLDARGIAHESPAEVNPRSLKPTQAEFSPEKVAKAIDYQGGERSVLVSNDGYVLDGHHQWMASLQQNKPISVIKLDAPIARLIDEVHQFPSATVAKGISTQPNQETRREERQAEAQANAEAKALLKQEPPASKGAVPTPTKKPSRASRSAPSWNDSTRAEREAILKDTGASDAFAQRKANEWTTWDAIPEGPIKKRIRDVLADREEEVAAPADQERDKAPSNTAPVSPVLKDFKIKDGDKTYSVIRAEVLKKEDGKTFLSATIRGMKGKRQIVIDDAEFDRISAKLNERDATREAPLPDQQARFDVAEEAEMAPFEATYPGYGKVIVYPANPIPTGSNLDAEVVAYWYFRLRRKVPKADQERFGITIADEHYRISIMRRPDGKRYAQIEYPSAYQHGRDTAGNNAVQVSFRQIPSDSDAIRALFPVYDAAKSLFEKTEKRVATSEPAPGTKPDLTPAPPTPSHTEAYGKANKIFTEDAANAARERLRKKLAQLNVGIDPEMIQDGITLAGYHLEAGARAFSDYARAMLADLGDQARPYLRSWYEGARHFPGFDKTGMTKADHLDASEQYDVWPGDAWTVRGQSKTVEAVDTSNIRWSDGTATPLSNWQGMKKDGATRTARIGETTNEPATDRTQQPGMEGVDQGGSETDRGGRKQSPAEPEGDRGNAGRMASQSPENVAPPERGNTGETAGRRPTGSVSRGNEQAAEGGNAAAGRARAGDGGLDAAGIGERRDDGGVIDPAPVTTYPNYHITNPKALVGGTPKARFAKNKRALETYLELKQSGLQPTPEQLDAMAAYIGWGSFGQELFQGSWNFSRPKPDWVNENAWLRNHLGKDAWESAQASILNAHYTDPPTVSAIWNIARKLGFEGGRVLEPSMGVGNFFGLMPRDLMAASQLTGIELDETTAGIAKLLYPDAVVRQMGYQDSQTADNFYDLIVGNWPFAKHGPMDRRYMKLSPSLHDYFFLKALDQVRPGGLVIGITSRFTMDKKGQAIRREMARKAELVASFRLPTGAFDEYAGTNVVTDVIILKKRAAPVSSPSDPWIELRETTVNDGNKVEYNQYYHDNPTHVLGETSFGRGTTTGVPGLIVVRPADFAARLNSIADRLPERVYEPRTTQEVTRYLTDESKDRQQSATIGKDGHLYQVQGERLARLEDVYPWEVKDARKTAEREAQIRALVQLRKNAGALFSAERDHSVGDDKIAALRAALKKNYQAFVANYGPINDSFGIDYLKKLHDPYYVELAALESRDGDSWRPALALERTTTRGKQKTNVSSIADALVVARNERMDFDMSRVAELANTTPERAAKNLIESGAVFETPDGTYVVADQYLSGNVRRKLREAKAALEEGKPGMARNVAALEKVIPKDVPYYNIEARMGASWIPVDVYRDFVREILNVPDDVFGPVIRTVGGNWKVDQSAIFNRAETDKWEAPGLEFRRALSAALNVRTVTIKSRDDDGTLVVDDEATKVANQKIAELREAFANWVWATPDRQVALERTYNEIMNAMATPAFDGSFLALEGMALKKGDDSFSLRKHQVDAIYRGIVNRRGLYAHEVGTGKTYTIAGVAMESRRYGIARKPLVFAHNANSKAVAAGIKEMYPNAKVLYIDNLSPDTIEVKLRQIKMDDWDAVVVPHSLIERFALSKDTLMDLAKEEIEAMEEEAYSAGHDDDVPEDVMAAALAGDEDSFKKIRSQTAKDLVRARNQIIASIEKQALRASKENAVTFEELGVDQIIVDEAHVFKKPPISTRMTLRGLNKTASARSIALNFLAGYVKKINGGTGIHLFTGTPITNTLTETYHMMRYIMDDEMKRDGLSNWDTWFNSFASETNDIEITSSGEYMPVTRLATFINVADLRRMMGTYTDIVFADDMPEFLPRQTESGKTMADELTTKERDELENGRSENAIGRPYKKVIVDSAEMTPEQASIMSLLVERAKKFRDASRKERKEIMLSGSPESPILVETDASNAGLDQRLFKDAKRQVYANGSPNSKAARAVKNILKHYREHPLATQAVFMDRGFDKTGFNLAKSIVDDLVKNGVPRKEIAIVSGETSDERRAAIADAMNRAEIRVVIGNTQTLGVGVNMQRNLRALHHLDAPWTPADLEQRNGRGHRQGNQWNTVLEYRYLTERLDGRRWQVLSVKDRFIKSFLKADANVRVIEGDAVDDSESGDIVATLSEAAGDPRILVVKKLKADIEKLQSRERLHGQAVVQAKKSIEKIERQIGLNEIDAGRFDADYAVYEASRKENSGFIGTLDGKTFDKRDDMQAAFEEFIKNKIEKTDWEPKPFGELNGLTLWYRWGGYSNIKPDYYVGKTIRRSTETPSISALQAIASRFDGYADSERREAAEKKDSIAGLKKQSEEKFGRADELKHKQEQLARVELDMQVNPVPPPTWLRNGAPLHSIAYLDGTPYVVTGHRWTDAAYLVELQSEDGKTQKSASYDDLTDHQGIALYEPHPFVAPDLPTPSPADAIALDANDAQQTAERSGVVSVPLKIARTSPIKALGKIVAKKDVRVFTNYVYTDENNIVATDGHHLVAIPNDGITPGYYDPKTEESVSIDIRYPDYEKVIPKDSDAKTTVEGVSLDALIGLINGAKKTTAAKKPSKKTDGVPIHLNDGQATGVYNAELLLNALVAIKAATGADTVTVRTYVRDKGSPQIKISDPTSGARAVVMGMSNIQGDLVSVDVRNAANVRRSAPNAPTLQPATIAQARTALARAVGADFVASMEKAGKLVFHDSDPTGTGAAGFVDPKGVVHLIPANMDQSAASVLAHEAIHLARDDRFAEGDRNRIRMAHAVLGAVGLKNFIGNPSFTDLAQQVRRMAAEGNKTAQDALAKAKLEAPHNVDEESVAYLAQYADEKLPLVRRILSAIRAALYRMGIKVALTPADVRALALSALKARAKMEINREARLERLQKLEEAYVEKHGPAAVGMRRVELLRSLPENATLADFERLQERALRASQATTEADAAEQERLWQEFQAIRAQFQAKEAMKTPFRRWFGEGVEGVTARDGKPITLYHGTNNPTFTKWDASRAGQATRQPTAGLGFFMTADKGAAYRFGSNLLELNAKIDKPYYLTDADLWAIDSVEAATKLRAKLQAQGYDGAVLAEPGMAPYVIVFNSNQAKFVTNENPTDNEDFRYSIPGRPARIDTPRVAAKVMNDIGGVRDALKPGESLRAKADPRNWAQMLSDLKSNARPAWLGLLTRNMQLELAREVLPRGAVTQFDEAAEAMDAYESRMIQSEGFPLAERWQNLMLKAPAQADRLSQLLYLSTWTGVDPRKPAEKGKEAAWTRAKAAFDAMADPNARALYGDVLAFYGQQTKRLFDELQARIDRTALPEKERRAAGDVLRKEFERMKQDGPYVPLMRFGDLTVFAEPRREGEKPVFATFETVQDQRAFADWLKREGYAPKLGVKADEIAKRALPAGDMVEKLAAIVDQTTKGPQAQVLKDAMYQLFLRSLPEQSIRKHFIHRRYVPGYSADALRTFATFARRSAKQIARLAHSDRLSEALDDMAAAAKTGDLAEPIAAGHLVNELDKTFQWMMNPTTNAVSSRLTHLGFMWHLGASPAHFFLNLSQQAQVTFPWLAGELHGKIGAGRIAAALAKANRDFLLSNPFVAPTKRGPAAVRRRSLLESEFGGDMGRALQALEEAGKTDKTQTYSLAGLSEEDSWLWSRPYLRKFTQGATWFFHTAEVINREATAIAAYRLARNAGMGHEAAYDLARRAINETHFDYSPSNRARFMRGNVAKVLTLFKQYSLNVSWQLARNLYLMSRGASPEVKAQARTKLLGMLGMTALMAGAAGLPLYGELMWLITQALNAGRDDDEPEWDADAELRELLNRAVGQPWSMAARKGLMNAFLGIDVSSRVKLDDLWWRSDERDLEGKQLAYSMMEQALGPVAGLFVRGVSTVDGLYESLVTGENARGASWKSVEGALPKTLKDISRSIRYAREGATTQQGATVMPADRFTTANEVGQALGFTPAELAERYAVNRSMKNLEQHIVRRRQALLDMMAMALRQGDEEAKEALIEDVKAFNRRYPTVAITGETLRQSLQAKARALTATEAAGGVSLNRNLIPLLAGKGE